MLAQSPVFSNRTANSFLEYFSKGTPMSGRSLINPLRFFAKHPETFSEDCKRNLQRAQKHSGLEPILLNDYDLAVYESGAAGLTTLTGTLGIYRYKQTAIMGCPPRKPRRCFNHAQKSSKCPFLEPAKRYRSGKSKPTPHASLNSSGHLTYILRFEIQPHFN